MTLDQLIDRWIHMASIGESIDGVVSRIVDEAKVATAHHAVMSGALGLHMTAIAAPRDAGKALGVIAPILELAVEEEDAELGNDEGIGPALIGIANYVDLIDCSHGPLGGKTHDTIRGWLPRAQVSRDDERAANYWSVGYATLALDDRDALRRFTPPTPFVAGQTFQFNLQGLLAHLAGAIDAKAAIADVTPAWDDLIASFPMLMRAGSVDLATMLWIARVVFHDIGGHPIETVMQRLHDAMWTACGKTP